MLRKHKHILYANGDISEIILLRGHILHNVKRNVLLILALRNCEDMFIYQRDYVSELIAGSERTSHMGEQLSKTNALDSFTSEKVNDTIVWAT